MSEDPSAPATPETSDFIREAVADDLASGRAKYVMTRYPPEPNGWLHIGHAKALSIDFGVAEQFGGKCNLRFDDTNPEKEDMSYVEAIKRDISLARLRLGGPGVLRLRLLREALRARRQDHQEGPRLRRRPLRRGDERIPRHQRPRQEQHHPYPARQGQPLEEPERRGEPRPLRQDARGRIRRRVQDPPRQDRHGPSRTSSCATRRCTASGASPTTAPGRPGASTRCTTSSIPLSDAIEGVTHSLCSLEYEIHRPLYEWFIREAEVFPSRQIEFARLNISHFVLSKRWLLRLVAGRLRLRLGRPAHAHPLRPAGAGAIPPPPIRDFMSRIGVAKTDSLVDVQLLEHCIREELNKSADRAMAVLHPAEARRRELAGGQGRGARGGEQPRGSRAAATRKIPFSKVLYIERDDFAENPPPKYFRLFPGNMVQAPLRLYRHLHGLLQG